MSKDLLYGGLIMPGVLVSGVSRTRGIGAAIASRLRTDGWKVYTTGLRAYDDEMPWGRDHDQQIDDEADLSDAGAAARVVGGAVAAVGSLQALVVTHTVDVGGGVLDMTPELIDRHVVVNIRATLLLMKEFALRVADPAIGGRIVLFTSGPPQLGAIAYAASKGAIEWITLSAATELGPRGITVNAINPGPNQTGWMSALNEAEAAQRTPLGRAGRPDDAAALVSFLVSPDAAWLTGQIISSDGGYSVAGQ
jgi:3-oxoacyl-[acyl-carrier protein] reductase